MPTTVRSILTPAAIFRLVLGWGAFITVTLAGPLLAPPVPAPLLIAALVFIVGVILICAFGVVHEAEHLARRLGDPYGSLVLTLSIVLIEVILIGAVLLGPGEHATIARDSVMAVSMIILNAVIGLALLIGGIKHGDLAHNRTGTSAYLAMLVVLSSLAFALPALIGNEGEYLPWQEIPIIVLTLGLYAFFLFRQMGRQADDFREVDSRLTVPATGKGTARPEAERTAIAQVLAEHRSEVLLRIGLLVATVLPIVLLSHDMAALLDDGLGRLGAPVALAGIVIAIIVFLPESITSVRAAMQGEIQRVINLCHGALVSTVGLTIPVVLAIGLLTDQAIVLAETPANLLLLGVTLLLSVTTFTAKKVTATHGAAHLVVFAVYGITVFS
ncbi:calcium:cation antiporter [Arthrobacter pigmenti]